MPGEERMTGWTTAGIILGIAVLALAMPREDVLLIPERRDWLAPLRRLSRKRRQRREADGAREADEYMAALHAEPETMTVYQSELPRMVATVPVKPLGTDETAPWAPAPWAPPAGTVPVAPVEPEPEKPKVKRDAPTIVMEVLRPGIERNLDPYLDGLPSYDKD